MNSIVSVASITAATAVASPQDVLAEGAMSEDSVLLALGGHLQKAWTEQRRLEGTGIEFEAAWNEVSAVVGRIETLPARTLDGLAIKALAVSWCHSGEWPIELKDDPTTDIRLAQSIITDLLRAGAPKNQLALSKAPDNIEDDPIFAAIRKHKAAIDAFEAAVGVKSALEKALSHDQRQSTIIASEREIVETDNPRWIETIEQEHKASDGMEDAAIELLNLEPKTLQGAAAVLRHAVEHMDIYGGEMMGWPDSLLPDGADPDDAGPWDGRSAEYFLMLNVAASLERLSKTAA